MSTTITVRSVQLIERIRGGVVLKFNWLNLDEVIAVLDAAAVAELHAKLTPLVRPSFPVAPASVPTAVAQNTGD